MGYFSNVRDYLLSLVGTLLFGGGKKDREEEEKIGVHFYKVCSCLASSLQPNS